jgi:lipopolysaccharide/colanic/teichoic acid biosynthesis glycosyltransferase
MQQAGSSSGRPAIHGWYRYGKRLLDLLLGSVSLLVVLPLIALVAAAIKLDSPGPVWFKQQRVGLGGRPFTMVKFRSMIRDADDSVHRDYYQQLVDGNAEPRVNEDGDPVFLLDDPRVTRVGRFLRRTSLDELPNLLNVLQGSMSLVGPRPPIPYEVKLYDERSRAKLQVKPGMTGLAQINGRGSLTFAEIIAFDLEYLERVSLRLDLAILLKTLPVVLRRQGV